MKGILQKLKYWQNFMLFQLSSNLPLHVSACTYFTVINSAVSLKSSPRHLAFEYYGCLSQYRATFNLK